MLLIFGDYQQSTPTQKLISIMASPSKGILIYNKYTIRKMGIKNDTSGIPTNP